MVRYQYGWMFAVLLAVGVLTGCTFAIRDTAATPTGAAVEGPPTQVVTATRPPDLAQTAIRIAAVQTATAQASATPLLTATPTATRTAIPTATRTAIPATPTPRASATPTATTAVQAAYAQPPTFTPVIQYTPPPTLPASATPPASPTSAPPAAQVCPTCGNLRLRDAPGTAGNVLTTLDANTPLTLIGRTADNAWVQVRLANGSSGWVSAQYVSTNIDLNTLPITGTADNLPTAIAPPTVGPGPGGIDVISGISANARQIFLKGQAMGNRANVFSKVGDSITFYHAFMNDFAGYYDLGAYSSLQPAVYFFRGPNARGENSFNARSLAAEPGWTTYRMLTPGYSSSPLCRADETPLVCEYRTAKPAVAIIMLGTVDSEGGITIEQYRANLETIVQISIDMGVIPVLTMIPPMRFEPWRDAVVDQMAAHVAAVARQYDVPLINYHDVMLTLPNVGLSGDGGHPSEPFDGRYAVFDESHLESGYVMRNLITLQMLYELWRQVLYDSGVEEPPPSDPVTYNCPGAPPLRLAVGGQGQVTPGLPNKLRSQPSISGAQIGTLEEGTVFSVVGGPHCADGYTWWKVSAGGVEGWTASGSGGEYWVAPYP